MAHTSHGHYIKGTLMEGKIPGRFFVNQCGGPDNCETCRREVSKKLHPNDHKVEI